MSNILKIAASGVEAAPTEYQISRSLRFNSADSAYLSRTPAGAGNRKTWTVSLWVKRSGLGVQQSIFSAGVSGPLLSVDFLSTDELRFYVTNAAIDTSERIITAAKFRDPSAWYHIVVAADTTQATYTDRVKMYVNGVLQSVGSTLNSDTQITLNADLGWNRSIQHIIGGFSFTSILDLYSGYLAEIHHVDGQALTPSEFGETDATTGVWKPKAYAGTYGTNGFYLDFSDNSGVTAATLGADSSGNGNNWTPNNFSVTAGAGNDSLVDTPTPYGTDTGAGGEVRGNYATLNPLAKGTNVVVSNGGLDYTAPNSAGAYGSVLSTIGVTSGKWYCEYVWTSGSTNSHVGIATGNINLNTWLANNATGYSYYAAGTKWNNGSSTAYGASYANGDVIGVAFDADDGTLTFYKNNVSQGTAFTGLTSGPYFFGIGMGESGQTATINFGQRPFAYTAPSGFKALCTQNLPTPTVVDGSDYFNTVLYTGNGSTQSITGVGFQPDWVWIKERSGADFHILQDALRGVGKNLNTNNTNAETGNAGDLITSFDSDGFTVNNTYLGTANTSTNGSGQTQVAWNWNAGGSNATNTDGTITSTVRANPTAGFSIVTFTAPASGAFTVGHGLGVAPKMYIMKSRSNAYSWGTYHVSIGNTGRVDLNSTNAVTTTSGSAWNNTSPTSTVFSAGADWAGSGITYVAYCFAEVEGFSKFGSYTGNGSADGAFVYCGFRPAWIVTKRTDSSSSGDWVLYDVARDPYNATSQYLFPNSSGAEGSFVNYDILSNGFKFRTNIGTNLSGASYIFAAFAQHPFKYSLAR